MNDGQKCGNMSDASKRKEKQKMGHRKNKTRQTPEVYVVFRPHQNEEFKDIMRNARRKLEIPMPAAMPCKTPIRQSSRKFAAVLENTRQRLYCRS